MLPGPEASPALTAESLVLMELRQQHAAAMQAIHEANAKIAGLAESIRSRSLDKRLVEKLETLVAEGSGGQSQVCWVQIRHLCTLVTTPRHPQGTSDTAEALCDQSEPGLPPLQGCVRLTSKGAQAWL